MVEINSFRGIFSVMREMIETEEKFQIFLKQKLKDKYFAFEQVIRFLRNVLNHIETADVKLKIEDFVKQKDYVIK
jgi:ferritin-like metal-binding protein YciE